MNLHPLLLVAALLLHPLAAAPASKSYQLSARASEIDKRAKSHPEIGFLLEKDGKAQDVEHASVDTRVPSQGKLVIWLMGYNRELFNHLDSYGMNSIQVCYPREWFAKVSAQTPPGDTLFLSKVRLESATGKDVSPVIDIPKPDGLMERSYQFVKWLARENPQGNWQQFLSRDGKDLRWDKVILCGISHGSTTAARLAKEIRVDRVVMLSGPRDQLELWQKLPSATPLERFFGFSHVLDDGWIGDHYPRSWQLMGLQKFGPVVNVDDSSPPYGNTRRLITTADVGGSHDRAHNSTVPGGGAVKSKDKKFIHEEVWRYLFLHPVNVVGNAVPADPGVWMDQNKPRPAANH